MRMSAFFGRRIINALFFSPGGQRFLKKLFRPAALPQRITDAIQALPGTFVQTECLLENRRLERVQLLQNRTCRY